MKKFFLPLLVISCLCTSARATVFTVTTTADSGAGSLRAAINSSNAAQDPDDINFAIPASDPNCDAGTNVCTIAPVTPLPALTAPVTINGYTQAGATANTAPLGTNAILTIEIAGTQPGGATGNGITISSSNCIVRGLVINRFLVGINIRPPAGDTVAERGVILGASNRVEGCFIGTAPDGVTARGNDFGIRLSGGAQSNVIGAVPLAARNLISGNSFSFGIDIREPGTTNNQVLNNLIGTTRTGNERLANGGGVLIQNGASNNQIGTDASGAGNLISGNNVNIRLANDNARGNSINGNLIGTNAAGTAALTNATAVGIEFFLNPENNSIGGGTEGSRNVISGNQNGVVITGQGNSIGFNFIGTAIDGLTALPNSQNGIELRGASSTSIIGAIVAGNGGFGIVLNGNFGANDFNLIGSNFIGVNRDGNPLGNGQAGVALLPSNASNNTIGGAGKGFFGNIIANNGAGGVNLGTGGSITGNVISFNNIYNNTGLGIVMPTVNDNCDADAGPNRGQNHPLLTSATADGVIKGTLNSTANTTFRIEFFSSPTCDESGFGEGERLLSSRTVTTDASCNAIIDVDLDADVPPGHSVSATATNLATNDTSGFSPCIAVGTGLQFNPSSYVVDEGAGSVTLTLTRSGETESSLIVGYGTFDGSATGGLDYTPVFNSVTFAPGETTKSISVPILEDTAVEGNEQFVVNAFPDFGDLSSSEIRGGETFLATAPVTIADNDAGPTPTPSPTPGQVQLSNISGRGLVQTNEKVGICGFVIRGGSGKQVIVRGMGPSLQTGPAAINNPLNDPRIDLYNNSGTIVASNNNWRSAQEAQILASGLAPGDDREAAIIATLPPGAYTAIVRGSGNNSGVALAEVYELQADQGQLANVSVRGDVLTDDNVLITGVILRGGTPKRILFRAIGPDLKNFSVSGEIQDPMLDVYDVNGNRIGQNDNWATASNAAEIAATGLAPKDPRESAVLLTLPAGSYTAIVRGVNKTTGIGLAEAFRLD